MLINSIQITAFAVPESLSQIAVGFDNGSVVLIRGDFVHGKDPKQRKVIDSGQPVTGLEFRGANDEHLCISTTAQISVLMLTKLGDARPVRTIDSTGCGVGCMTIDSYSDDIVVVREDAMSYYRLTVRGRTDTLEGIGKCVKPFQSYLVVVSSLSTSRSSDYSSSTTLTILHPHLMFVAHRDTFPSEIRFVFCEWGDLFVMTMDGQIYRYHERSVNRRLEALFQRDLYVPAVELATFLGLDSGIKNVIYRKYGDFLYKTKDYDTAMQQYLRAIDCTEPSQVIRKFLDAQRIHNLVDYLEELHKSQLATYEHTTLLLNCYAKLKDVEKLEAFLKSPGDLKFDLATAISMCRQGGYYDQAAFLARKFDEHDTVIDILVADSKRYAEAVAYITRLSPDMVSAESMSSSGQYNADSFLPS